jgi:lysozyme
MQTSDQGRAALKLEEGEVLRAYRCPAGEWSIGVGLTAASGVVKPVAGMVITREQSDMLLTEALKQNYEPAVEIAMARVAGSAVVRPQQHEFDAGVSFHFNTGAIARASWVDAWKNKAGRVLITMYLRQCSKGGGKVLPGLEARREREATMLLDGVYRQDATLAPLHPVWAQWGITLSNDEVRSVFTALRGLGYNPGDGIEMVYRDAVLAFQRDHDLTPDGIIGRATLSTLQRAMDARARAVLPAAAAIAVPVASSAGLADTFVTAVPHLDSAATTAAVLWLLTHAWTYRDIVAAKIAPILPRVAAFLRSF